MTRKDYVAIAQAISDARLEIALKEMPEHTADMKDGAAYAAEFIADALARDNSRFDRSRFLAACGVQS